MSNVGDLLKFSAEIVNFNCFKVDTLVWWTNTPIRSYKDWRHEQDINKSLTGTGFKIFARCMFEVLANGPFIVYCVNANKYTFIPNGWASYLINV